VTFRLAATVLALAAVAAATPGSAAPATAERDVARIVMRPATHAWPATWHEQFVVPYGAGRALLGTSPGGDNGTLDIGPEYGAPAADGSWWFLDAAKQRVAHYDADGHYLGQVHIPRSVLVNGRYFQWQLPHVLADGTLVAARQDATRTWLLRVRAGHVDEIPVQGAFAPTYDDGRRLYGFSGRRLVVVDPQTGSLKAVRRLRTPSGTRFSVSVGNALHVALPGAGVTRDLRIVTRSGAQAHVGLQLRAGVDDTLTVYLLGAGEDDESVQLVGAARISPNGRVSRVEALPDPFSEADPGSPAELTMAPGSSVPLLVYVLPDGVHVYARTG
jgi:hypothetical protein